MKNLYLLNIHLLFIIFFFCPFFLIGQIQLGQDIFDGNIKNYGGNATALSSDGSIVAVGGLSLQGTFLNASKVRIYSFNGISWNQLGQDINGEAYGDYAVIVSLSSDGSVVAIGAPDNDGNGSNSGHVRIYSYNGGSWVQMGQDIDGDNAFDEFGHSVSLSADGNTVAIGAPQNDGNGSNSGHVRVYSYNGGSWIQLGQDIDGENNGDLSGGSVSLSANGNSVAIGAVNSTVNGYNTGHARIYTYNDTSWIQLGQDIDGDTAYSYCGWSVSMSADGNIVSVSSPGGTYSNFAIPARVRVYDLACSSAPVTGVLVDDIIHDRARFNWDDMNQGSCSVDQIRIRYREIHTNSWSTKTMGAPVGNSAPALNTSKLVLNLTPNTQYEYDFKIWYQDGTVINWHANGTFTTLSQCDNVMNVTAIPDNNTKTTFCWTPVSTYSFVRLKYRENVPGSSFSNIGGMGVMSPTLCKQKNGITPGSQYRVMWRTWCNPAGGPYRSAQWDGPVIWDQPTSIRVGGGSLINNLEIYPNPTRDIFNIGFTSDYKQSIEIRVVNLVGEIIFTENLDNFVGEYTNTFYLEEYPKGVYLLELDTDNGTVNKKLILQ